MPFRTPHLPMTRTPCFGCVLFMILSLFLSGCNPAGSSAAQDVDDTERPSISGAIALSNTSILVSYSEAMSNSAAELTHYSIVPENTNLNTGSLGVTSAQLSSDKTSVTLTTQSQGERSYILTAVNVKDVAGNVIQSPQAGVGVQIDPARAAFIGIAPDLVEADISSDEFGQLLGWIDADGDGEVSVGDGFADSQGNTFILTDNNNDNVIDNWQDANNDGVINEGDSISGLIDSDLDGLQDNQETLGWTVTVISQTGTESTREVTSNPGVIDTDGDGLTDFEEYANGSDPRLADTDSDGLSDYREWNIIFSNMLDRDSDDDGLPDLEEVTLNFTSPRLADSDGDNIEDGEEIANNRNPRIADRPDYSIAVKSVFLHLDETYEFTDETNTERSETSASEVTIKSDTTVETTRTDAGVEENVGNIESSFEAGWDSTEGIGKADMPPFKAIATVSGGKSWTDTASWQADETDSESASETYADSLTKFSSESKTKTTTRNVNGGQIKATVDINNHSDFTLTFSNIQISVLRSLGRELQPIATLSLPDSYGDIEISPLDSGGVGENLIFENLDVPANLVEELMQNLPNLKFEVSNYTVVDNEGYSFAKSDQDVFNKTAGIVIDYGDSDDVERYLVSTAGSEDVNNVNGGGWQGGINSVGTPRGISLNYALQDIIGIQRHYAYDTIEVGPNAVLDTVIEAGTDDVMDVSGEIILPGPNGWLDTQPEGDDKLVSFSTDANGNVIKEQGVIAGADRRSGDTYAGGDDIPMIPANTVGIPYGSILVDPGADGVLDAETIIDDRDPVEFIRGFQTSRSCVGNASTVGAMCTLDSDCNNEFESSGSCTGPERISRIKNLKSGDFNRDWFVFVSEDLPTAASFEEVLLEPGQIYRLAFLQDLDRDGLTARTEAFFGSRDSAANVLDNNNFGKYFNLSTELAAGRGDDVYADSKDSDYDGIDDFAEIKVGWKVQRPNGDLTQVYSSPSRPDSDFDGLLDIIEMDLRSYCSYDDYKVNACSGGGACIVCGADKIADTKVQGDDLYVVGYGKTCGAANWKTIDPGPNGILDTQVVQSTERRDALCAFLENGNEISQAEATFIIAGKNGTAESVLAGDDVEYYPQGTDKLIYGKAIIEAGDDGILQSTTAGDDQYSNAAALIPSTDPNLSDTDGDNMSDFDELAGYLAAGATVDGGNGLAESNASGDDIALVQNGLTVVADSILISAGLNAENDSTPGGDDVSMDPIVIATDPLVPDTDGDFSVDGLEFLYAGNPLTQDELSNLDSDGDGLSDAIETNGWTVNVNGTNYFVTTDPLDDAGTHPGDSDNDGLPDLVERRIGTIPRASLDYPSIDPSDSDGDGISDYDEFNDFNSYTTYSGLLTNFNLASPPSTPGWQVSAAVITDVSGWGLYYTRVNRTWWVNSSPTNADIDNDGINDFVERTDGTDPGSADTDGDSRNDYAEKYESWLVDLTAGTDYSVYSNPLDGDVDQDGFMDAFEAAFGTDPGKANTDDDPYGVEDFKEFLIGTDPLNSFDRCVLAEFASLSLIRGVTTYDTDGYLKSNISINKLDADYIDLIPGDDRYYSRGEDPFNVGDVKPYSWWTNNNRQVVLMGRNEQLKFTANQTFKDYGAAAWIDWGSSTQWYTPSLDFDDPSVISVSKNHDRTQGWIHMRSVSKVSVILDDVTGGDGDCN